MKNSTRKNKLIELANAWSREAGCRKYMPTHTGKTRYNDLDRIKRLTRELS